jgi:hypothetical protein
MSTLASTLTRWYSRCVPRINDLSGDRYDALLAPSLCPYPVTFGVLVAWSETTDNCPVRATL